MVVISAVGVAIQWRRPVTRRPRDRRARRDVEELSSTMSRTRLLGSLLCLAGCVALVRAEATAPGPDQIAVAHIDFGADAPFARLGDFGAASAADRAYTHARTRLGDDILALQAYRPGYTFWRHLFARPDGAILFGSAVDGRLLAVFPAAGDWTRTADWIEPSLSGILDGQTLPRSLNDRRDVVAALLEARVGPVVHNPSRGDFLQPNLRRYGRFLGEWGAIYERFGVPAEIGLAQAVLESGLSGTVRSSARAVGFCQWLSRNWTRLNGLTPHVIEGQNQTTQAPYCAAYLAVLGAKYRTFIAALSEHHAGATNVGRTIINGERLGGADTRQQYFFGAQLVRDLRLASPRQFSDIYGSYGPRSFLYAEMVFGNARYLAELAASIPQVKIHAMRTSRALPLADITFRTRLSADEVRRYNPALVRQVPARATVYLPSHVAAFGQDVAFWHRPPSRGYAAVLDDFLRLDRPLTDWDTPSVIVPLLRTYERRFRATKTEEGGVMATVIAYVLQEVESSPRTAILADFRTNPAVLELFQEAVRQRDAAPLQTDLQH
jgi:hypothetical protein